MSTNGTQPMSTTTPNVSDDGYPYYDYNEYYTYEYSDHIYQIFDFEVTVYGYLWPILVILTSCFNILVVAGFLRPRMRTPINALLISIAVSDSLTGLVTLPAVFHVYGHERLLLSKEWCNITMISRLYISRAFHTVSIWQTLVLGIHRYLSIRWPTRAQRWCTMRNTLISIGVIYVLAFVVHVYHTINIKTVGGMCSWVIERPCTSTCVYIWITILLVNILPGVALLVLTILMFLALRGGHPTSQELTSTDDASKNTTYRHRRITIVVVIIVIVFLIPEIPYAIFHLIIVGQIHSKKLIFPLRTNRMFNCVYEMLLVVSFHVNFWVYCLMMPKFRSYLKCIFRLLRCKGANFDDGGDGDETSVCSTVAIQLTPFEKGSSRSTVATGD